MINELTKKEIDEAIIKLKNEFKVYKNYKYKNRYYDINVQRIVVSRLANLFNFNMYESDKLPLFVDGIISSNENDKSIIVNAELNSEDKKYMILYLLSYYMLHIEEKTINYHTSNQPIDKLQRDENIEYMTRCLLIPKEELEKLEKHLHNPEFCAKLFGTTEDLINLRIKETFFKKKTLFDILKRK